MAGAVSRAAMKGEGAGRLQQQSAQSLPASSHTLLMVSSFSCILLLLLIGICSHLSLKTEAYLSETPVVLQITNSGDLDNSIQQTDAAATNSILSSSGTGHLSVDEGAHLSRGEQHHHEQDNSNSHDNLIPVSSRVGGDPVETIERRLDRLEFELRKWKHHQQLRFTTQAGPAAPSTTTTTTTTTTANENFLLQLEAKWSSLVSRLELMEKFITTTTHKLYETEQRVKQLEKCDCRLGCKWSQPKGNAATTPSSSSPATSNTKTSIKATTDSDGNGTLSVLSKLDGQVWESNCDVCSCHRGHVRCSHIACPEVQCPDPHHVAGKCCPVCYKPCVYKGQTVRHGNKVVINSNQDTCKECMCIDGRLRCQRIGLAASAQAASVDESNARRLQRSATQFELTSGPEGWLPSSDYVEAKDGDQYLDDDDDDDAGTGDEADYELERSSVGDGGSSLYGGQRRRRRRSAPISRRESGSSMATLHPPLVCPQIDCRTEDQFRLQNDCCTYCKGFDFCAHQRAQHLCHPRAYCLNTGQNKSSDSVLSTTDHQQQHVSAMFQCHCESGFQGNGRQCSDIDECAQLDLNECDLSTTTCVNQPGSYRCKCKRGFRPLMQESSTESSATTEPPSTSTESQQSVTANLMHTGTPTTAAEVAPPTTAPVRRCVDIDECSDGKLNRCHPQAKCTNLPGTYKCICKRGYLGNGIECHKWVSSDPKVAAYLHRHSPQELRTASNDKGSDFNNDANSKLPRVQLPLGTLDDPEDDLVDDEQSTARSEAGEGEEGDFNGTAGDPYDLDQEDNYNTHMTNRTTLSAAKLSEAKQEPLLSESTLSQQSAGNNQQQNGALDKGGSGTAALDLYQSMATLNTRFMFMQPPPPRFWRDNVIATTTTTTSTSTTNQPGGAETDQNKPVVLFAADRSDGSKSATNINQSANYERSDRNDPVYIQPSSETAVNQHHSRQTRPISEDEGGTQTATTDSSSGMASNGTQKFGIAPPNTNNLGYKRGTIIASAKLVGGRGRLSSSASSTLLESTHNLASSKTKQGKHEDDRMAAHRSAPSQTSGALSLLWGASGPTTSSQIAEISLVKSFTSHSFLIMPYILLSSVYIYCIHLNHLVTFYFI